MTYNYKKMRHFPSYLFGGIIKFPYLCKRKREIDFLKLPSTT